MAGAEEGADGGAGPLIGGLLPVVDAETWREAVFDLLWHQYGGSGLGLTHRDILELDVQEVLWFRERVDKERRREASELRKVHRGRR